MPLKYCLLVFCFFIYCSGFSQKDLRKISIGDLPKNLQELSNVSAAVRWTDSLGDNILIVTKKTIEQVSKPRMILYNPKLRRTTSLKEKDPQRAFHYLVVNDSAVLTWEVAGLSRLCEEEITYTKNWFVITDIDNDSKAEIWLIYKNECLEKLEQMKIVMFQDNIKYSAIGKFKEQQFQKSNFDQNFLNANYLFQKYAIQLWQKFATEHY